MKIEVLAFGAHPDDIELSCSGVLLVEKNNGRTTGVIDLTEGELGTRGTSQTRIQEAADSAKILGLDIRKNLKLADGFFRNDRESQLKVVTEIRTYQPEIILCNAPADRHPDHGRSSVLVSEAAFLSGLRKIETVDEDGIQEQWRPKYVLNYIQDRYLKPDFVVDISTVFEQKLASIRAFKTQFDIPANDNEPQTYISTPDFLENLISRHRMFGKMIGVKYAEGFISAKAIGLKNFDALIKQDT